MNALSIRSIHGRQIFDSRGMPTVEAEIVLHNGVRASASVPSGASTGRFEACELRDNLAEYHGKGVSSAVNHINTPIQEALVGESCDDQWTLDNKLMVLDGTQNKSKIGANAILAVSLACAKAAAKAYGLELFRYLGGLQANTLPIPTMNILNGGAHAGNNLEIQEFMIVPVGAHSFTEAMKMGTEIYASLRNCLKKKGLSTGIGDEGGYAPDLNGDEEALSLLMEAIQLAGYQPNYDVKIALDAAANEWYKNGHYIFPKLQKKITQSELQGYWEELCQKYPIYSIEDPFAEEDFPGFSELTASLGGSVQIVGDDLFVTNPDRLRQGISSLSGNAVLIKPNQIGTLTETLSTIRLAKEHGYGVILSHRSGETEDTTIADLSVAVNAGQIKTGAPARSERVCKYNRLLKIESLISGSEYPKK